MPEDAPARILVENSVDAPAPAQSGALAGRERTRFIVLWATVGLLLVAALFAAIGTLQRDVYSARGFVAGYLDAVARGDARAALALPGAAPSPEALAAAGLPRRSSSELLRSDVLPGLSSVAIVGDASSAGGVHRVTARTASRGQVMMSTFRVEQTGSILGIFPTWRFATTPLTAATITVAHAADFTAGPHTLYPRAFSAQPSTFDARANYLLLTPGAYRFSNTSKLVDAQPVTAVAGKPGSSIDVSLVALPTPAFTAAVAKEVRSYLDACATQKVLQPSNCPFGVAIDDRVEGTPSWTMAVYPIIRVIAGSTGWQTEPQNGVARVSVTVRSLFDGTLSTRSIDAPFAFSLSRITIRPDGSLDLVTGD